MAGAVRCPRKWSSLAIELCAQIQQESLAACEAACCAFRGTASLLLIEVKAAKKASIAPKTGRDRQAPATAIDLGDAPKKSHPKEPG